MFEDFHRFLKIFVLRSFGTRAPGPGVGTHKTASITPGGALTLSIYLLRSYTVDSPWLGLRATARDKKPLSFKAPVPPSRPGGVWLIRSGIPLSLTSPPYEGMSQQ